MHPLHAPNPTQLLGFSKHFLKSLKRFQNSINIYAGHISIVLSLSLTRPNTPLLKLTLTSKFLKFQAVSEFREYSFPADIWSLGALISFRSTAKHLFYYTEEILAWTMKSVLPDDYSIDLKDLVAGMLDPKSKKRPTGRTILKETRKYYRQA